MVHYECRLVAATVGRRDHVECAFMRSVALGAVEGASVTYRGISRMYRRSSWRNSSTNDHLLHTLDICELLAVMAHFFGRHIAHSYTMWTVGVGSAMLREG